MKKLFLTKLPVQYICLCLCLLTGCCGANYSLKFKEEVSKNAERFSRYNSLLKDKKTTPDQDKAFISANTSAWKTLEEIVNK